MGEDRKSFLVYGDIEDLLDKMDDTQVAELFRGMVRYFNSGEEPELSASLQLVFIQIRQQMDRDSEKWEKRREKNRENIRKRWEKKKSEDDTKDTNVYDGIRPYTNDTVTVTVTDTVTDTVTGTVTDIYTAETAADPSSTKKIIDYLNEKAGTSHKPTEKVQKMLGKLFREGYTFREVKTVIDKKCSEWLGDDRMRPYLRPSTLFGDHFEEYLAAPLTGKAEAERSEAEKKERARIAKEKQKEREAKLDADWLEENRERLEATRKKYGIGVG